MRRTLLLTLFSVALFASTLVAGTKTGLRFIEDDYGKAVSMAKTQNVPLFVEAWAPW